MKRKCILAFAVLLLSAGIVGAKPKKQTAVQTPIVEQPAKPATIVEAFGKLARNLVAQANDKPTFAFMALNSDDGNALVENYVTDALTEAMFATGKIKVVERASLEKIMSEQQFQSSAFVNENTAAEIGNLSGADFVCYGTLKDLKSQISVSVRVVEVSTAELYAMNRDTVEKDAYLVNVGFEKRKESAPIAGLANAGNSESSKNVESTTTSASATASTNSTPAQKPRVNSIWQVRKKDNGEYTTYTFTLKSSDEAFLFVGYDKYKNGSSYGLHTGIYWKNYSNARELRGSYDIKDDNGNVTNKDYTWAWWSYDVGWRIIDFDWRPETHENWSAHERISAGEIFAFAYNKSESARFFLDLFEKNKFLTIRHNGESLRFKVEGFWQTVEDSGLIRAEIEDAIADNEF